MTPEIFRYVADHSSAVYRQYQALCRLMDALPVRGESADELRKQCRQALSEVSGMAMKAHELARDLERELNDQGGSDG